MKYALLFLASDEGRYVTGVTLPLDAGVMLDVVSGLSSAAGASRRRR